MTKKTEATTFLLPEGRLINQNLFVKDQFNENSKPVYNIELAYEDGVLDDFYNACLDAAVDEWGDGADKDSSLHIPILSGDKLAAKREAKGKAGDAYKGKEVIRASTQFNKNGTDGPGGVQCFNPDVSEVGPANQDDIYQGCYGQLAVVIGTYKNNEGNNAITLYIQAFQKTKDGDRLVAQSDHSKLFKPVGRTASDEGGRRSRAG